MKAIGVVEGGADTVLDVCIAGAEFCKPIRMQRYPCGSGCTAGVFFVQILSEKRKPWYTVLKRITIVDKSEYQKLMNFINREDPKAFVTIYNVSSVQYQPKT